MFKNYKKDISGEVVFSKNNFKLIKLKPELFVIDMVLNQSFSQIFRRQAWFFDAFSREDVLNFIKNCINHLSLTHFNLISHNIYASKLCEKLSNNKYIFDAYDNLLQFPKLVKHKQEFLKSYKLYFSSKKSIITTNSKSNIKFFKENFNYHIKYFLTNGVDQERFRLSNKNFPDDLKNIKKPIIGFGGKITHLIDTELFKFIIKENKNINFVIVGQVLDKKILKQVTKFNNCFYLGDKTYDEYVNYVTQFDIAIVPYVVGDNESGANTIKVYEYIAANCQIVATKGCGVEDLKEFVNIANNKHEFSDFIKKIIYKKEHSGNSILPKEFTWKYISNSFLKILYNENNQKY